MAIRVPKDVSHFTNASDTVCRVQQGGTTVMVQPGTRHLLNPQGRSVFLLWSRDPEIDAAHNAITALHTQQTADGRPRCFIPQLETDEA